MKWLFFFLCIVLPTGLTAFVTDYLLSAEIVDSAKQVLYIPVIVFLIIVFIFRERFDGRVSVPSVFSFEHSWFLALGSALCSLSGLSLVEMSRFVQEYALSWFSLVTVLFIVGSVLASIIILKGPVYGWD